MNLKLPLVSKWLRKLIRRLRNNTESDQSVFQNRRAATNWYRETL